MRSGSSIPQLLLSSKDGDKPQEPSILRKLSAIGEGDSEPGDSFSGDDEGLHQVF